MTFQTRSHGNIKVVFANLNGIIKLTGGELKRVHKSIFGLYEIAQVNVFWSMTRVTGGHMMMAGFAPAIVLIPHDMTIHAGLGVIREIGIALTIDKGERAHPHNETQ